MFTTFNLSDYSFTTPGILPCLWKSDIVANMAKQILVISLFFFNLSPKRHPLILRGAEIRLRPAVVILRRGVEGAVVVVVGVVLRGGVVVVVVVVVALDVGVGEEERGRGR